MRYHVDIIHEDGTLRHYDVLPGSFLTLPAEISMPWTDSHIPRTERPVRFSYVSRQCAFSRVRISIVTRSPFPPARAYW